MFSVSKQFPTMEDMLWRFPHIGVGIFKKLSNKNLAECKKVARTWKHFVINEKFYKVKVHYEMKQKELDRFGRTPLHNAARDVQLSECKLIIDHVENKNLADKRGCTPLHLACENGHLDVCKLIIERIQDKNPVDRNGWTILHTAAENGYLDICKLIIERIQDKNPATSLCS